MLKTLYSDQVSELRDHSIRNISLEFSAGRKIISFFRERGFLALRLNLSWITFIN